MADTPPHLFFKHKTLMFFRSKMEISSPPAQAVTFLFV